MRAFGKCWWWWVQSLQFCEILPTEINNFDATLSCISFYPRFELLLNITEVYKCFSQLSGKPLPDWRPGQHIQPVLYPSNAYALGTRPVCPVGPSCTPSRARGAAKDSTIRSARGKLIQSLSFFTSFITLLEWWKFGNFLLENVDGIKLEQSACHLYFRSISIVTESEVNCSHHTLAPVSI